MKLPFHKILGPMIKPYLTHTKLFCSHPTFSVSTPYTYMCGILGLCINAFNLKKYIGEVPLTGGQGVSLPNKKNMVVHDLKIIATSMGLIQYMCLLIGCLTYGVGLIFYRTIGTEYIYLYRLNMETESGVMLNQIRHKHKNAENSITSTNSDNTDGLRVKLRALLVALLGVSMSACAFASQPVELEMDDDEVTNKLNNVSFARRITKPTIRLVMGYGKLSAFVTAATSLLLLVAVMSKQSWWRRGARWLAAPALLVAALEAASDASDALLAAVLRGTSNPLFVAAQTAAACLLITVEILVWYFIAKFFEYNPPGTGVDKKESVILPITSNVQ